MIDLLPEVRKVLNKHSHLLAAGHSWGIPEDVFESLEEDLMQLFSSHTGKPVKGDKNAK